MTFQGKDDRLFEILFIIDLTWVTLTKKCLGESNMKNTQEKTLKQSLNSQP